MAVIIPAFNEEQSIGRVLKDIPRDLVQWIIVADNGSTDGTARAAREQGAEVVSESRRGYGNACLAGIASLAEEVEFVAFMDGDYSDYPGELRKLVSAMLDQNADMVIGSRVLGQREKGSLTPQQRFGNWLSTRLIRLICGFAYTDLGPFRAIRAEALRRLKMQDRTYGWTVEMQMKALQHGMKVVEIPVSYRKRIGKSKVSGTVSGTLKAGAKILWTIGKLAVMRSRIED
ncbi:MAG: glycosyltransferase family 2 protein [Acidobacteria bacterium]|nr:glycosyltransferase family 2 protein [Acidobacteriota bacterium]MCI0723377.1 glycosyltransferase family 2 protein [Acidobacteriota bacterium]